MFRTEDTTAPVISDCPHNLTVTREKGLDPNTVTWSEPSATDDSGNSTVYSSHIPGDVFPPGPTMVNYIFTDGAGNSASCIFIVTVAEGELNITQYSVQIAFRQSSYSIIVIFGLFQSVWTILTYCLQFYYVPFYS